MGKPMTAAEQHIALSAAVHFLGIGLPELWLECFAMGGSLELFDLEAYIYDIATLRPMDRAVLEQVLWELDPVIFDLAFNAPEPS